MLERIRQIIIEKGLQPSSFADKIQVSRGTISHILKGRNDPGKDTIEKILNKFPDISSTWLLLGEGPMYNRERIFVQPTSNIFSEQQILFDEKKSKSIESTEKPSGNDSSLKNESKKPENKTDLAINQNINIPSIPAKRINKIMIFFDDKTYMTFIPEE